MIEINNLTNFEIDTDKLKEFIERIIKKESVEGDLSVAFLEKKEMARLNETYRNKEGPTDVLSFEGGEDLGEVLISPAVVKREKGEDSFKKHLRRVLAHGVLHLAGYDHKNEKDRRDMLSRQEDYLVESSPQKS